MVAVQTDSQIVAGEGGGGVAGRNFGRIVAAEVRTRGCGRIGMAEGADLASLRARNSRARRLMMAPGTSWKGRRLWCRDVFGMQDVEIGEGQALDEGERAACSASDSPGKPVMTSAPVGGVGRRSRMSSDAPGVVFSAVPSGAWRRGCRSGAGLPAAVEVLGDAIRGGEEFDEILGDVEGSMELMRRR